MLLIALQCHPDDCGQALALTQLICDIEPEKRKDVEFMISARMDTSAMTVQWIEDAARQKFETVHVLWGKRHEVGWPDGPNAQWAETMMRASIMRKSGKTKATGILTMEPDCVPMRKDWIEVVKMEWQRCQDIGMKAIGHFHPSPTSGNHPDRPAKHLNGNAIFKIGLLREFPALNGCPSTSGWDVFHSKTIIGFALDSDYFFQIYQLRHINASRLQSLRKNGQIPALFHGIKGEAGIQAMREILGL